MTVGLDLYEIAAGRRIRGGWRRSRRRRRRWRQGAWDEVVKAFVALPAVDPAARYLTGFAEKCLKHQRRISEDHRARK